MPRKKEDESSLPEAKILIQFGFTRRTELLKLKGKYYLRENDGPPERVTMPQALAWLAQNQNLCDMWTSAATELMNDAAEWMERRGCP